MNVRNLLRKLIGWDELDTRFVSAQSAKETEVALSNEIERLRNRKIFPKFVRTKLDPSTWEEVVAAYAETPEHFKEQS